MTAEIAILNKTAIALAADSAVTLSAGRKEEKIFDSADKLFELSLCNPIAVMIYNGMNFMEVPLPSLIKEFRQTCAGVDRVQEAADSFLNYLAAFGATAPSRVKDDKVRSIVEPVLEKIRERYTEKFQQAIIDAPTEATSLDYKNMAISLLDDSISVYEYIFKQQSDAEFIPPGKINFDTKVVALLKESIKKFLPNSSTVQKRRMLALGKMVLSKGLLSGGRTGIVVAGFGRKDLFPTLVSIEIDGIVCDRLKILRVETVDIDRQGPKARVLPFAQKEMVERFLYGLDNGIQRQIAQFCKKTVPDMRSAILKKINFEDEAERQEFEKEYSEVEEAFLKGLQEMAFEKIRSASQSEIEDMVEFMPKPELAKMAEALVNLTSIKRRVSRAMETVGGPIDVAVISQSEGFVWIKRKHYFPAELNARYFNRSRAALDQQQESKDGTVANPGIPRGERGGASAEG